MDPLSDHLTDDMTRFTALSHMGCPYEASSVVGVVQGCMYYKRGAARDEGFRVLRLGFGFGVLRLGVGFRVVQL